MSRIRNCSHIGCHNKVPMGTAYCDQHKDQHRQTARTVSQYNKTYNSTQRDQEANKFYQSTQWEQMRAYVYARDMGIDQVTGQPILGRYITDHIHPLSVAPNERLSSDNLWLLSIETHGIKTMIEGQLLASPNGINKAKHVTKEWYTKQILSYMAKSKKG